MLGSSSISRLRYVHANTVFISAPVTASSTRNVEQAVSVACARPAHADVTRDLRKHSVVQRVTFGMQDARHELSAIPIAKNTHDPFQLAKLAATAVQADSGPSDNRITNANP
jgi:hypothetical protein